MSLPNQKKREIDFLLLYSLDLSNSAEEDLVDLVSGQLKVSRSLVRAELPYVIEIRKKQEELDEKIQTEIKSYNFNRIYHPERAILRLALFEILFNSNIPPKVSLAEGIRLAKKFGTPASASFVNAVLDHFYKRKVGETTTLEKIDSSLKLLEEEEHKTNEALTQDEDKESREE